MMLTATVLGLRASLALFAAAVAVRVLFRWLGRLIDPRTNLDQVGDWWRATWFLIALGMMLAAIARLASGEHPPNSAVAPIILARLAGLTLLNLGMVMAKAGFNINRGSPRWIIWPMLAVPPAFVLLAIWGTR